MRKQVVYFEREISELPENWESKILLYKSDRSAIDTALFEEREGDLMKIGGPGKLELSEVLLLEPIIFTQKIKNDDHSNG